MKLTDRLKNLVTEPDAADAKPKPAAPPLVTGGYVHPMDPWPAPPVSTDAGGGGFYDKLKERTDFATTETGRKLAEYLEPLAGLALDDGMKIKTAVAQAKRDGLTAEKILAEFDGMLAALPIEADKAAHVIDSANQTEVIQRQTEIESVNKQVEELQQKLVVLSTDMTTAKGKLEHAANDLKIAVQRRDAEIKQEREHYRQALA